MIRRLAVLLALLPSLAGAQIKYTAPPGVAEIASYSLGCIPKATSSTGLDCSLLSQSGGNVTLASGQLLLPDGTSGAPAIARSAATGTGIYFGVTTLNFKGTTITAGDARPSVTGTYDFGSTSLRWRTGYFGGATLTASTPAVDIDQAWNNAGVTFTGLKLNISTDTASAAGSLLIDAQVGSASKFSVTKAGTVTAGGGIFAAQYIGATSKSQWSVPSNGQMNAVNWTETENAGVRSSRIVEVVTTTKSPSALENGEIYTNTGDADGSTITLLNDPTVGSQICVAVDVAQTVTVAPGAGEVIAQGGTDYSTSCTNATVGSAACFVAATGGAGARWIFLSATGTWTCS